jgi:NACHT domain
MMRILVLSSNPSGDLKNLNREIRDLKDALERLNKFEVKDYLAVGSDELQILIAKNSPQFVHFCGHGAGEKGLVFEDREGQTQFANTETIAAIFETFSSEYDRSPISCVVLNACYSEIQAKAIVKHINYVIGMSDAILDKAAYHFSLGFYGGLAAGKSIEQAHRMGCIEIRQLIDKTNAQSTQVRKLVFDGEVGQSDEQLPILEYNKPVLLTKENNSIDPALPDRPLEFTEYVEYIEQEIDRKTYKDDVRAAYDNFGQFSAQNVIPVSKSEDSQRKILLRNVKQFWIEGFLQPSLLGAEALQIGAKSRPDAIADLTTGIEKLNVTVELDLSYERLKRSSIYQEIGRGRTLLILGSPGGGKTIALLQLAQRIIEHTEQNPNLPIPVVLNLSSWGKDRKPIVDWSIDELREKYQVPKLLSEPWIQNQQLIFLLDGLDEVDEKYRNDCVRALNNFISMFPLTEIAVCSRVKDYEALTERLEISSALCLQPLSLEQVYGFLDKIGGTVNGLKTLLRNDVEVEQFVQTPLILNFMSVAYAGWSVEELIPQMRSISDEDRRLHLFDTYIDLRLKQGATSAYPQKRILNWLSWLASRMFQRKRTIFLIEKIQPNWLQNRSEEMAYRIITFIVAGLFAGFNGALIGGLTILLIPHLMSWDREVIARTPLVFGITAAIIGGITTAFPKTISPLEQFSWSWQRAISRWLSELLNGVGYGLILGLMAWLIFRDFKGLYFGLVLGHIFGLFLGLGSGLGSSGIKEYISPNQGIRSSVRNCIVIGLISGLMFGMILGLTSKLLIPNEPIVGIGVIGGLIFGLIFGLKYGGAASTQHFMLRQILYRKGRSPWNYSKFLKFASERLLMKKVGGGYVFFHRMLLEHFAGMNLK